MKIYKLSKYDNNNASEGFAYFSAKIEAERAMKAYNSLYENETEATVEEIEFHPTKKNIIRMLNEHASHNDNG